MNTKRVKFGGRQLGTPNRTSSETKEALQAILSKEIEHIPTLLNELSPKDKLDALIKLMPYIIPKQTEVINPDATQNVRPIIVSLGRGIDPDAIEHYPIEYDN